MNIYERLIEILIEQKKGRTKPSSTKAEKKAKKDVSRVYQDTTSNTPLAVALNARNKRGNQTTGGDGDMDDLRGTPGG